MLYLSQVRLNCPLHMSLSNLLSSACVLCACENVLEAIKPPELNLDNSFLNLFKLVRDLQSKS